MFRGHELLPLVLLLTTGASSTHMRAQPGYEITLTDQKPTRIDFRLGDLPAREMPLVTRAFPEQMMLRPPVCGSKPLGLLRPGKWLKPSGCVTVHWSATVTNRASEDWNATRPSPGWNSGNHFWLLTEGLPWLEIEGQRSASVRIAAQIDRRIIAKSTSLPGEPSVPVAIAVGVPVNRYLADGFTVSVFGDAPKGVEADRLYRRLASVLAGWRRDIVPSNVSCPDKLDVVWFSPPAKSQPGVFASSGSDAVLMQYVSDPKSVNPSAKLQAAILMTGAHEGFHRLMGCVPGSRPAWANESLATYFAYRISRQFLRGAPLALASELVDAPARHSLLAVQRQVDGGDGSEYDIFYSKGSRFWTAIDKVLTVRSNATGRLAALLRQSSGLGQLDWSTPLSIEVYLDHYNNGRAGPIVRCYLVEDGCPIFRHQR